jgi:penicillin-binding protein 1A
MFNLLKKILLITLFFLIFGLFFMLYFLWKFSPELPSYTQLKNYNPSLASRVFTSDGLLLDKYFIEERIFVPINRIPENLINAFISAEDKNFFKHRGIDFLAILRASMTNIFNKFYNRRMIGASTITQQVVKNLLLTNEISFERKFKEMILAIRIENILNKSNILELYLNDIYLGYGSYGVASASLNYFNKSLNELTLDESAFLAALPKAPNNYNPVKKYKNAINRRNWVLDKMFDNNFINENQLFVKNKPLIAVERYEDKFQEANYFKEEVRKQLYQLFGQEKLYEKGLIVKTSINTDIQRILDEVLINGLIKQDKKIGWRGAILNSNLVDFKKKSFKEIKNPFPKKWLLQQVKSIGKNELKVIDKENNVYSIKLNIEENSWLLKVKFNIGDIFFTESLNKELIIIQVPEVN